ncbi:hypothetical protein RHMOL_Rhmol05G0053200 [Rhododendron molle]|uniref:Uncharacterized protein n=1 Tax=Rhododendron molle TaxID=49168 RepID=A0ACC0NM07_RHOML|nr:hypothetical protein RHMOL_Rhmol05G0053200 [Rhododendron molle]
MSDSKNLIVRIGAVKASIRLIIHPLSDNEYELILLLNGTMNTLENFIAIEFDGTGLAFLRFNRLWKAPTGFLERVIHSVIQFFIEVAKDPRVRELAQEGLLSFLKEHMNLVMTQLFKATDDERGKFPKYVYLFLDLCSAIVLMLDIIGHSCYKSLHNKYCFMDSSHSAISFSISLMLGSLNVPSSSSASHRHLISEVYKFATLSENPMTASCGIRG